MFAKFWSLIPRGLKLSSFVWGLTACAGSDGSLPSTANAAAISSADLATLMSSPASQAAGKALWARAAALPPDQFAKVLLAALSNEQVVINGVLLTTPRDRFAASMATWDNLSTSFDSMKTMLAAAHMEVTYTVSATDVDTYAHLSTQSWNQTLSLDDGDGQEPAHAFTTPNGSSLNTLNFFTGSHTCAALYADINGYYHSKPDKDPLNPGAPPPIKPAYSYATRVTLNLRNEGIALDESADLIAQQWNYVASKIHACGADQAVAQ